MLSSRCLEDILLSAARRVGLGLTFVNALNCDICVVSADELLGHRISNLSDILHKISAPIVAFGLGTEGGIEQFSRKERSELRKILKKMSLIGIRNHMTAALIEELTNIKDYEIIGDPILSFKMANCAGLPAQGDIGVNVIQLPGPQQMEDRIFQTVASCIVNLLDASTALKSKCHVFCFDRDRPCNDETKTIRLLSNFLSLNSVEIHPHLQDVFLSFSRLKNLDVFISMRTNPALLAAANGTIPIVLEHRGTRGQEIMDLIDCSDLVLSPYDINDQILLDTIVTTKQTWGKRHMKIKDLISHWQDKQEAFAHKVFQTLFHSD